MKTSALKIQAGIFVVLMSCVSYGTGYGQSLPDSIANSKKDTLNHIRSAEDLLSGSYQDVLNSFYQLAFKDLTSVHKEFQFTSSLFAIRLKANPNLNLDKNFIRENWSRNTNISWALKLDSNFHFDGFSFGVKYALINKRDYAVDKNFIPNVMVLLKIHNDVYSAITQEISESYGSNEEMQGTLISELDDIRNGRKDFFTANNELQDIIRDKISESSLNKTIQPEELFIDADKAYKMLRDSYAGRFLLVSGVEGSTFKDQFLFRNVAVYAEGTGDILAGTKSKNGLEIKSRAQVQWSDDSTTAARDLARCVFHADLGLNWVLRNAKMVSLVELKAAASYNKLFLGAFPGEDNELFTLDGTLNVHITKDIFIPLSFKYDPKNSNVFGLLSVTTNFDLLNRLLSKK